MLLLTTNEVPGHRITMALGAVIGATVRTRGAGSTWVAGMDAMGGGEVQTFTQLMYEIRVDAMNRLAAEVQRVGGNALVGLRFDSAEVSGLNEVCAYGTAVIVEPVGVQPTA